MAKRHRRLGTILACAGARAGHDRAGIRGARHRGSRRRRRPPDPRSATPRQRPTIRSRRSPSTCRAASRLCSPSPPARSSAAVVGDRARGRPRERDPPAQGHDRRGRRHDDGARRRATGPAQRGRHAVHGHGDARGVLDPRTWPPPARRCRCRRTSTTCRSPIPLSDIANNTIQICLPPPDVPAGTPGRADLRREARLGARSSPRCSASRRGAYTWRAAVTPVHAGPGHGEPGRHGRGAVRRPDAAAGDGRRPRGQGQGADGPGHRPRPRRRGRRRGRPRPGAARHPRRSGRATTRAGGVWTTTVRLPTATALLRASATCSGNERRSVHAELPAGAVRGQDVRRIRGPEPACAGPGIGRSSPTEEGTSTG